MSSFNRSPKRLRLESLREEEIVIPRITEWQFETPEGPEEGEISSARPRSSRPNVDLPARLRPIRWRNVGRDARRGGLWNQVLEFLAWDAENRTSKDGSGVEQSQGSGKEVIEAASNEGEETGEVDGIAAWGEKGSNKLDLGNEKLAPLLCPQSLPSGALSGGAKWRTDKAKGIREDGSEAGSQSGDRPSTVESTHSPNALANPEVANGEGGGAGGAESLEGLNPAEVSGLSAPALKKPIQQSESAAKASQLPPSQTTNGTPEKALKALDQTPTSEHTGPSKPQTLSENGSRERGSGNAAPDTVSRGAEVVEQSQTADVPPCEVVAPQDNNHIEPSKAPGPAEAACPETAENGLQGDAFGHEPGPQRWCVGEEDEAGKMAAPSEGGQQAEALQPGDMPAAGETPAQPANEIETRGANASVADGPAADPSGSIDIDDLALSTRIGGAHKKPGHSRGKLNGRRAQQIAARGSAAGGACPGDLAGSGSDLPSDGAKEVGGVPGSSGRANVVNTPPEVREIVPAPICQPSKDCHVASSDRSAIGPTDIAHEQTPRVSNRSEEQTLNGPLQACRSLGVERPSLETLAGPANQGEGGVEDRQFVHARIPKRSHGSVLVAGSGGAEEASARLPGALGAGSTSEPPAAANDKVPRVSAEMPMECVVETLDSVGGLSEAQAGQQHLGASPEQERSTAKGPNPARSAPVDPPLDKLQGGLTLGEKACEEVPDATLQQGGSRQSGSLAPVDATPDLRQCSPSGSAIKPNSEGAPNSEALPPEGSSLRGGSSLPGGSSLELPDMSDVELAALLEHVPPPDGDALPPIDGGELWGAEQWSFLGQGLLGSFKSLPCLLSAVPAEEVVPDRNRSLKRSFSEVDALTGGGQAEKSSKCHLSKKASFVVTVPPKQPGPAVETRVPDPSMGAPTALESTLIRTDPEVLDSPTMSTSFIDRDLALLGLAGLGTSLEDGHVSATCRLPARPPTPSSVPKNPTHAPPSVAPIPPSVTRTKPRSTRKERRPAGKRKLEELARDDAQKDLRTVMLLAEIAQEISERERVIELESLRLADGLAQKRLIELYADAIDLR